MARHLSKLGSLLGLAGMALVAASATAAGPAAPTGTPLPPPSSSTPPPPSPASSFLLPSTVPTYLWRFNGNLEDSGQTAPRGNLTKFDGNTPLAPFKPGRDGSPNGSITQVGRFHDPRNEFRQEAFTFVFDVFPDGQSGCIDGELFADGRAIPSPGYIAHPYNQTENFISVHGCPGTTMPSSVTASFKNQLPDKTFADVKVTAPISSGAWHDVIVVYDGPKRELSMFVDGTKTSAPLVGAITLTGAASVGVKDAIVNDVLIGGPMMIHSNFFSAGRVNELKFYGRRALYPMPNKVLPQAGHNASVR